MLQNMACIYRLDITRFRASPQCLYVVLILLLPLAGCANATMFTGASVVSAKDINMVCVLPIEQDRDHKCGYAAMATVALHHGVSSDVLSGNAAVAMLAKRDLTAEELRTLAKGLGLVAFSYTGSLEDIQKNIDAGRPMLALLHTRPRTEYLPGVRLYIEWAGWIVGSRHWVVVLGYLPDSMVIYDPAKGLIEMSTVNYMASWKKTQKVCVLVARGGIE